MTKADLLATTADIPSLTGRPYEPSAQDVQWTWDDEGRIITVIVKPNGLKLDAVRWVR